jgi:hypothetical protein
VFVRVVKVTPLRYSHAAETSQRCRLRSLGVTNQVKTSSNKDPSPDSERARSEVTLPGAELVSHEQIANCEVSLSGCGVDDSLSCQVVSSAALERMAGLRADSPWIDNVLLEWILILELMLDG